MSASRHVASWRAPVLLCSVLLSGRLCGAREDEPRGGGASAGQQVEHCFFSPLGDLIETMEDYVRDSLDVRVIEYSRAPSSDCRVAAAVVLAKSTDPASRKALEGLLRDPDMIVRRVAAESLFGGDALASRTALKYRYAEALAAECKARALARTLAAADLAEQHATTKKLIALGRPALWGLHRLCRHTKGVVAGSAAYAMHEVSRRDPGAPPAWWHENKKKFARRVTFERRKRTLGEIARLLSGLSGLAVRPADECDLNATLVLGADNTPLSEVLDRACKSLHLVHYAEHYGSLLLNERLWTGTSTIMLDVRDIEATGRRPNWQDELRSKVFPGEDWLGVPEHGSSLDNDGGILTIHVPANSRIPEREIDAIRAYYDGLRRRLGLSGDAAGDGARDKPGDKR